MAQQFEKDYAQLVDSILFAGEEKHTRNGMTRSLFGRTLHINMMNGEFPLLQGRKMFPNGVLGEFAAMVRKPKHIDDFKKWGCNYWELWAEDDGRINVDYGNAWFEGGQLDHVRHCLKNNPGDRRMVISSWIPENLKDLSLPCCHYAYQFYVSHGKYLDMIWTQRSCDMMIGIPADIILAAIWVVVLANEAGLKPGNVTMNLGDCHIYEEHFEQAQEYLSNLDKTKMLKPTYYELLIDEGEDMTLMTPEWFFFKNYQSLSPLKFKLKA